MGTVCPYCNIEVGESAIEAEDGCCPECGSIISVSSIFGEQVGESEFEADEISIVDDEDDGDFIDEEELPEDLLDGEMDFSGFDDDDDDDDRY